MEGSTGFLDRQSPQSILLFPRSLQEFVPFRPAPSPRERGGGGGPESGGAATPTNAAALPCRRRPPTRRHGSCSNGERRPAAPQPPPPPHMQEPVPVRGFARAAAPRCSAPRTRHARAHPAPWRRAAARACVRCGGTPPPYCSRAPTEAQLPRHARRRHHHRAPPQPRARTRVRAHLLKDVTTALTYRRVECLVVAPDDMAHAGRRVRGSCGAGQRVRGVSERTLSTMSGPGQKERESESESERDAPIQQYPHDY